MAKILCEINNKTKLNEKGFESECVTATCSKFSHVTMSWGVGGSSVMRCLALLKEECPKNEKNFYIEKC